MLLSGKLETNLPKLEDSMNSVTVFSNDNWRSNNSILNWFWFAWSKKTFPREGFSFPIKKEELTKCILSNSNNLRKISKIVHPIVRKKLNIFLNKNKTKKFIILDIPLYLENKLNNKKDVIVFIDAKNKDIKSRLLKRKSYNEKMLRLFKKIQLPLSIKRKKSNFIIKNNFSTKEAKKSVKHILKQL